MVHLLSRYSFSSAMLGDLVGRRSRRPGSVVGGGVGRACLDYMMVGVGSRVVRSLG